MRLLMLLVLMLIDLLKEIGKPDDVRLLNSVYVNTLLVVTKTNRRRGQTPVSSASSTVS